jgi:hypothetical protein
MPRTKNRDGFSAENALLMPLAAIGDACVSRFVTITWSELDGWEEIRGD